MKTITKIAFLFLLVPFLSRYANNQLAYAYVISIDIAAEVGYIFDDANIVNGRVNLGDIITGTYTYESTTPNSGSENNGRYEHTTPPFGVVLEVNGFRFRTDPDSSYFMMMIANDILLAGLYHDYYIWQTFPNLYDLIGSYPAEYTIISLQLDDHTGTALSSGVLPTLAPDLAKWTEAELHIDFWDEVGNQYYIWGDITSAVLSPTPIPEPSTMLLLGSGLFGLVGLRKKFRK